MATVLDEARRHIKGDHPMPRIGRLFGDHLVTATDLNRRGGAILDIALNNPVTITRNDQHFALLRRELVALLAAISDQVSIFTEAMRAVRSVLSGKELHEEHPFQWLHVYEPDDLTLMVDELIEAITEVAQGTDAEAVEGVIHEWYESAIAAESEVLDEAFTVDSEPVPLTEPPNDRGAVKT